VKNHLPSGLKKASLPLLSIARAESKSRERDCFHASLPWQRNSWALRSVSTVALSSTRAQRFYHHDLPETYEFVKVRSCWAIVKELHWTFHLLKSGLFISRFCRLFIPLLTHGKGLYRLEQLQDNGKTKTERKFIWFEDQEQPCLYLDGSECVNDLRQLFLEFSEYSLCV